MQALLRRLVCVGVGLGLAASAPSAWAQLVLAVEAGPDRVRTSEVVGVEVTVANLAAIPAAAVTLELDLPANLNGLNQNLNTAGGSCVLSGDMDANCESGETVRWTLGALPSGARKTVSAQALVIGGVPEPPDGTVFTFNARARDGGVLQASASESATKLAAAPLELFVDEASDPVAPGANLEYALVYGRLVAGDSTGTSLAFALPPGTSFVSASDGGGFSAGTVTWNLGTLGPGRGGARQVTVHVDTPVVDGALLRGTAQLSDAAGNLARAQVVSAVQANSPLALSVEALADPSQSQAIVDVELTIANTGASTLDTLLEMRLDEYFAGFAQSYTRGGVCNVSGDLDTNCEGRERMQWDLPPLAPGEHTTVTLPPQVLGGVSEPANGTLLPFRAELFEQTAGSVGASRLARYTVRKQNALDFELALDESVDPVEPGALLRYDVAWGKNVSGDAPGTVLELHLPPATSFVSASDGGTHSAGVVTWNLGTVSLGQTGVRQATVSVDPLAADGALLEARAQLRDSSLGERKARASCATVVELDSPLEFAISAAPDPAFVTEGIDAELTVTNVGATPMDPVVELRLDNYAAAFPESIASHGGDCNVSGDLNTDCDPRERVRWVLDTLAPGQRATLSLATQVVGGVFEPGEATLMGFRAEVFEELPGQTGAHRRARGLVVKQNLAAFELDLDESVDPVEPGADLGYTLSYGKVSSGSAANVVIAFQLPAGTSFVSASDGGTHSGGVVSWNVGTVGVGTGGTRRVFVHVDTPAPDGRLLEAAAQIRDDAANSTRAETHTVVRAASPLALALEATPDPATVVESIDTQITVGNTGATTIDAVLELRLDDGMAGFNELLLIGGGDCNASGNANTSCDGRERIVWDLAPLAPGEHVTVELAPQLVGSTSERGDGHMMALRAEAYVPDAGQFPESRLARTVLRKRNVRRFEILADDSPDPVAPGADLTYTLRFGHHGTGTSAGGLLVLPLPAGTSFVSASDGGAPSGGAVTWTLPALPAGHGGMRTATLHVDAGVDPGSVLETAPRIEDFLVPQTSARAPTATVVQASAPLALSLSATPDPARPVNVLDADLVVTNNTGSVIAGAVLELRVPEHITGFAQAAAVPPADCTVSGNGDTTCSARERVRWLVPDLAPFGSAAFSIPPQIFGGTSTPSEGTLIRFFATVFGSQAKALRGVRVGFADSDGDGVADGLDNCGTVANPTQTDADGDATGDACDTCPTLANANQNDGDADLVGDLCDNCTLVANPRVPAAFFAANSWVTMTGGQRDDDADGLGNRCDGDFPGTSGGNVGPADLAQFRASNGESRIGDTCGTNNLRPCAIYDLDENTSTAHNVGPADLARFRILQGSPPGPKCALCPIDCVAGATGFCPP